MEKIWFFSYDNKIDKELLEKNGIEIHDYQNAVLNGYFITHKNISKQNFLSTQATLVESPNSQTIGHSFLVNKDDLEKIRKISSIGLNKEERELPIIIKPLKLSTTAIVFLPKIQIGSTINNGINKIFNTGDILNKTILKNTDKFMKISNNQPGIPNIMPFESEVFTSTSDDIYSYAQRTSELVNEAFNPGFLIFGGAIAGMIGIGLWVRHLDKKKQRLIEETIKSVLTNEEIEKISFILNRDPKFKLYKNKYQTLSQEIINKTEYSDNSYVNQRYYGSNAQYAPQTNINIYNGTQGQVEKNKDNKDLNDLMYLMQKRMSEILPDDLLDKIYKVELLLKKYNVNNFIINF